MSREEMIEVLIQDRLNDWVFASNCDGLEDVLWEGWKGYGKYTDNELKEEIEMRFEQEDIDQLLASSEWRKEENRKREEEEEKGISKVPFE